MLLADYRDVMRRAIVKLLTSVFAYDDLIEETNSSGAVVASISTESHCGSGRIRLAVFVSLVLLGTVAMASPAGSGYHLVKSVPIGAPGDNEYFDYVTVDPAGRRVCIAHGAEVKVLDADNFP